MKKTDRLSWGARILIAALLLIAVTCLIILITQDTSRAGAQERRDRCLVEAVKYFPALAPGEKVTEIVPECKSLDKDDREKVGNDLVNFVEAAFNQASTG